MIHGGRWACLAGLGLLGLLWAGLLTGCAQPPETDSSITLRFSTWGSAEELTQVTTLIRAFEQQHPTIHVKLIHIPENYFQKLHILMAGGLAPDVMFVNSLSYPVYADKGLLLPLERHLAQPQGALSTDMFFEAPLQAFRWKNHLYAIPRDVSDLVVFYNRDLFAQAGIPEPRAHWTLDDMRQTAQKLTRHTDQDGAVDQFGISFFGKPPFLWLPFVWSAGGTLFDATLSRVTLDEPAGLTALAFYRDLRTRWHVAPDRKAIGATTMSQLFLQQKLAMLVGGRWSVPLLRRQASFRWDVAPFPRGRAGSVVGIDASGYAVSSATRHPQASWALITFLSSRSAQTAFAQSGLIVPARKDAAQSDAFLAGEPRHGQVFLEAMNTGRPTHVPVRWNEIAEELNVSLESAFEGQQTLEEAITRLAPRVERLLK